MDSLSPHLRERGRTLLQLSGPGPLTGGCTEVDGTRLASEADLVIAVGGDGTLLHAAQQVARSVTPLLGINRGRLGFLTDISPDRVIASVDAILAGHYVSEQRTMLRVQVPGHDESIALNDVVIQREGHARTIDVETFVDGIFVNTHNGDGLIIATPTGSTAYALSGGGPILEPSLEALVIVPICPHTLSDRPIVIDGDSRVQVRLRRRARSTAVITCDGHSIAQVRPGQMAEVSISEHRSHLLHPEDYDYFRILRSKLHWGQSKNR